MALPWVRLDSNLATNHKILGLAADKKWQTIAVFCFGLGYSGGHGTAGFIPQTALPFIHANKRIAMDLCEAGLWVARPGGWEINDWAEYQPAHDEAAERSRKAKAAAEIRWAKQRERESTA